MKRDFLWHFDWLLIKSIFTEYCKKNISSFIYMAMMKQRRPFRSNPVSFESIFSWLFASHYCMWSDTINSLFFSNDKSSSMKENDENISNDIQCWLKLNFGVSSGCANFCTMFLFGATKTIYFLLFIVHRPCRLVVFL